MLCLYPFHSAHRLKLSRIYRAMIYLLYTISVTNLRLNCSAVHPLGLDLKFKSRWWRPAYFVFLGFRVSYFQRHPDPVMGSFGHTVVPSTASRRRRGLRASSICCPWRCGPSPRTRSRRAPLPGPVVQVMNEHGQIYAGWWFGTFFIFPYIGNNHPN